MNLRKIKHDFKIKNTQHFMMKKFWGVGGGGSKVPFCDTSNVSYETNPSLFYEFSCR